MWFKNNRKNIPLIWLFRFLDGEWGLMSCFFRLPSDFLTPKTTLAKQQQVTTKRWQKKSLENYNFYFPSNVLLTSYLFFHIIFICFFFQFPRHFPTRRKSQVTKKKKKKRQNEGKRRRGLHKFQIIFISYIYFFLFPRWLLTNCEMSFLYIFIRVVTWSDNWTTKVSFSSSLDLKPFTERNLNL